MAGPVCIYGNPVLRKKSEPVNEVTDEIRALIGRMLDIMYDAEGIGLAAEQVGRAESLFVIDIPADADRNEQGLPNNPGVRMPEAFINPEIIGASEETTIAEEGCLSFPKLYVPVERPAEIVVRYLDRDGKPQMINAKGLLARAIQHENDHLNGVLLVDHMTQAMKLKHGLLLRKLKKQNKEGK
ncbi:MAG: peptide deformylase [Kiritimatiellales bacterium]